MSSTTSPASGSAHHKRGRLFDLIDIDGDGVVVFGDLRSMAHTLLDAFGCARTSIIGGRLEREYRALWRVFDTSGDRLDRDAFLVGVADAVGNFDQTFGPVVHCEFAIADRDHDDLVSVTDLKRLLKVLGMTDADLDTAAHQLDQDGDGYVSRIEYYESWRDYLTTDEPDDATASVLGTS